MIVARAGWVVALAFLGSCGCPWHRSRVPRPPIGGEPVALSSWAAVPPPDEDSAAWRCAAVTLDYWIVERAGGEVRARGARGVDLARSDPVPAKLEKRVGRGRRTVRPLDGELLLVGSNAGEWGGSLEIARPSTGFTRTLVSGGTFMGFLETDFGLFAAHAGTQSGGTLYGIRHCEAWQAAPFAQLPGPPLAFGAESPSTALVVTMDGLHRVDRQGRVTSLHRPRTRWLAPVSLAVDAAGRIWIGGQHVVIRLTPRTDGGYDEEWLTPIPPCPNPKVDGPTCVCES